MPVRVLLIDNYDSFTYNLFHYLGEAGAQTTVRRNDDFSVSDLLAQKAYGDAIVISPGPCTPEHTGHCKELLTALPDSVPVLGVCLGHQLLFTAEGGKVFPADIVRHGKPSPVTHNDSALFNQIPNPFTAMRYHSLITESRRIPPTLHVTARSSDDHQIMAIAHRSKPRFGVQFHPESWGTPNGQQLIRNFLSLCANPPSSPRKTP